MKQRKEMCATCPFRDGQLRKTHPKLDLAVSFAKPHQFPCHELVEGSDVRDVQCHGHRAARLKHPGERGSGELWSLEPETRALASYFLSFASYSRKVG